MKDYDSGIRLQVVGFRIENSGFRVQGSWISGAGCRDEG